MFFTMVVSYFQDLPEATIDVHITEPGKADEVNSYEQWYINCNICNKEND